MNKMRLAQKYELEQITLTEFPNQNMYQKNNVNLACQQLQQS